MTAWKRNILTSVKIILPIAILCWLFFRFDHEEWEAFREQPKSFPLLAAAFGLALLAIAVTFFRWGILVRCLGIPLSMTEAYRLGAIGFLLSFVSVGSVGGDLFKAIFLASRSSGKRVEAVASVVVDRLLGLYGLIVVGTIALSFVRLHADDTRLDVIRNGATVGFLVGTIGLGLLIFGGGTVRKLIERCGRLPLIGGAVQRLAASIYVFHTHPWAFFAGVLMSVSVHSLFTISMYLIARGLYSSPPTLLEHFVIAPAALLASALPITPAGLGVFEAAFDQLYHWVPVPKTLASGVMVALVFELVRVLLAVVGVIFYWTAGADVRHSIEAAEETGEAALEDAPEHAEGYGPAG